MVIKLICVTITFLTVHLYEAAASEKIIDQRIALYLQSLENQNKTLKIDKELIRQLNSENRPEKLLFFADVAIRSNLLPTAEAIYKKLINLSPGNMAALRGIAITCAKLNQFSKSAAYFENYHSNCPGDMLSHFYHGEVANWQKEFEKADMHYRLSEKLFKKKKKPSSEEKSIYSRIQQNLGQFNQAQNIVEELHQKHPSNPYILIQYIDTLIANDEISKAVTIYDQFMEKGIVADREVDILLKLIKPRLMHADLNSPDALTLTDRFIVQFPDSAESVSLKAGIMNNLNHWRTEKEEIKKLRQLRKTDEDILRRESNLWWLHSSFADLESYYSISDEGDRQFISRLQGEKRLSDKTAFGIKSSLNAAYIPKSFDKNGNIENRSGTELVNEIYTTFDFMNADQLKLSLYYPAADSAGAGLEHKLSLDNGSIKYYLHYRKPYWGITEGLLLGQVRDRAFIEKEWLLSNRLKIAAGTGLNRYGLEHACKTGETVSVETQFSYRLKPKSWHRKLFGYSHGLFINYNIDKEDVINKFSRLGSSGNRYFPVNHTDREVHSLNVLLDKTINGKQTFQTYIGYSYDRKSSDHGPNGGWLWRYRKTKNFEIRCFGSYALTTTFFTNAGLGLRWVF